MTPIFNKPTALPVPAEATAVYTPPGSSTVPDEAFAWRADGDWTPKRPAEPSATELATPEPERTNASFVGDALAFLEGAVGLTQKEYELAKRLVASVDNVARMMHRHSRAAGGALDAIRAPR